MKPSIEKLIPKLREIEEKLDDAFDQLEEIKRELKESQVISDDPIEPNIEE